MEDKKYKCSLCRYRTDRPSMIQRHKNKIHKDVCNNKVIKKYLEKNNKIFSEKDIDNIVNECNGSVREILKVVKILRKTFGRNVFVSNIRKIISDKIKSTAKFHESKKMIFKNKSGDYIETVLTKVTNLESFIEYILQKRGYDINQCEVVIGLDGGQKKLILTMNIIPYNENEVRDKCKASGNKRTIIIAKVDGVPENHNKLKVILDEMELHKIPKNISLSCDLKVVNIILGNS